MTSIYRPPCDEGVIRAAPSDAPCAERDRKWVLAATILGSGLAVIDASSTNVALPALQASLHANVVEMQWVINAYTLTLAALILPGGSLGDRLGRARIFAAGVAIFALASLWCGLAPDIGQLIAARILQGVGGALLIPGSLALIGASFPPEARGRAIGLWSGFSALMAAAGAVIGGWMIDTLSWRWIFFANVPIAAVILAVVAMRVPESRDDKARGLDWFGAALITASLAGLAYGLLGSQTRGFGDPIVLAALIAGATAFAVFLMIERRLASPIVPLRLFRSSTFGGANLFTFLLYGSLGGALFFLPLNLIQIEGYTATQAGAALLPFVLLVFLLSHWVGGLVDRCGAKPLLIVGPSIAALGFALFALSARGGSYWFTIFPAALALGIGMATIAAPLTTTVMNAVEQRHAGLASGINNAVARAATLLGVSCMGIVMLWMFATELEAVLATIDLPTNTAAALRRRSAELAAMTLPQELDAATRNQVSVALGAAFLAGYRTVMAIAAALALVSAATAWLMITEPKPGGTSRGGTR